MFEDYKPEQRSTLERFIGGRPTSVVIKLVLISLMVGFVMSVFGFNAVDLVNTAIRMIEEALRDGTGVLRQLGSYILAGAAIVVPVWFILRLTRSR